MIRVSIEHEGNRREHLYAGPLVSIGRANDNDICLLNALVSRHHCQIDLSGEGAWLEDLASANGVTVNGLKTRGAPLAVGDMIELGSTVLKILELGEQPAVSEEESAPYRTILSELPDEREKLRVFARLTRELSEEKDTQTLLKLIVDEAIALLGGERGFLVYAKSGSAEELVKTDSEELGVRVARSFDGVDIKMPHTRLSLNVVKSVLESGEALLSLDAAQDERFEGFESIEELRLKSVVCLPVSYGGSVRGALLVDNRLSQGVFKEEDLEIAELFADQAAIALQDAHRREEISQHSVRLEQSRREVVALNAELGRKVRDQGAELSVVRAELGRERARGDYSEIIGASDAMREVFEGLDRIMESDLPVLIAGESGTGKELIARAIHKNGSRSKRPFISENCSAIPETLLESELFGHVKGAFTGAHRAKKGLFETADSGTLFLDEIGDMSPAMQAKLLRVLQEGKVRPVGSDKLVDVDVRLLAASHMDLAKAVSLGTFREDLYYRIHVLQVELPPLRERLDDIPILAEHLLTRAGREAERAVPVLPQDVISALCEHSWPGNVRELENEMRRLLVLAPEGIERSSLSKAVRERPEEADAAVKTQAIEGDLRETIAEFERSAILAGLERAGGNKSQAARALGISRFALQRKLEKYGFETDDVSESGEAKLES
jgi:transcriptional regulator with GAF, ATPase, and Fis domain